VSCLNWATVVVCSSWSRAIRLFSSSAHTILRRLAKSVVTGAPGNGIHCVFVIRIFLLLLFCSRNN
jgi:hypothetical protein